MRGTGGWVAGRRKKPEPKNLLTELPKGRLAQLPLRICTRVQKIVFFHIRTERHGDCPNFVSGIGKPWQTGYRCAID